MNGLIERIYAQTGSSVFTTSNSGTGTWFSSIGGLVTTIISWFLWIAGILAFVYLVYSGILYISAAGNPDQAKKGQQGIINAVIGIIIITLAYTVLLIVQKAATTATPS